MMKFTSGRGLGVMGYRLRRLLAFWLILLLTLPVSVWANPSGEQVVSGSATFNRTGHILDISQGSDKAIIDWQSFSIGGGEATNFLQPSASSAMLNRVISSDPSQIYGNLTANGQVFLINQNGILVGASGIIDTNGFVASTLDVSNGAFLSGGDLTFLGASENAVINLGKIDAVDGDVLLIARDVQNAGEITASNGTVALTAGSEVLVKASGSERVFIQAGSAEGRVENSGLIDSASAELKALGGNEFALAINNEGAVRATGVEERGGRIWLVADQGTVENSGSLTATKGDKGGEVQVLGDRVALTGEALVDVSGEQGGGAALIGGDFQGNNVDVKNADKTFVGADAQIKADALVSGDGGEVIVWSDEATQFYGDISATGGNVSGDGGLVEVSGKENLVFRGNVVASAVHGENGQLLLDPKNITVADDGAAAVTDGDAFADDGANDITIDPVTIETLVAGGTNVTLQANNDITISDAIVIVDSDDETGIMTFEAGRSITVDGTIQTDNRDIFFYFNDTNADADNRDDGVAAFINNSLINSGLANVTISADDTATDAAVNIATGIITANNLTITNNEVNQGGLITLNGLTVAGNLTINAATGNVDIVNTTADGAIRVVGTSMMTTGGDVDIQGASTDFEIFGATAANVTLYDKKAVRLGASNITGDFKLDIVGPIGNTGGVIVGGTTYVKTTAGGFGIDDSDIDLSNAANDFNMLIVDQDNSGSLASFTDANGLVFGGTISEELTITSAGNMRDFTPEEITEMGDVTFSSGHSLAASVAPITFIDSGERTTLNAGATGDIAFDHADTDFGVLRVTNAHDVLIKDTDDIVLESSVAQGSYSVTAGSNITVYQSSTITADNGLTLHNTAGLINLQNYATLNVAGGMALTSEASSITTGSYADITVSSGDVTMTAATSLTIGQDSDITLSAGSLAITTGTTVGTGNRSNLKVTGGSLTIDADSSFTTGQESDLAVVAGTGNMTITTGTLATGYDSDFSVAGSGAMTITADSTVTTGYDSDFSVAAGSLTVDAGSSFISTEGSDFKIASGNGALTITADTNLSTGQNYNSSVVASLFSVAGGNLTLETTADGSSLTTGEYSRFSINDATGSGAMVMTSGTVTTGYNSDLSVAGSGAMTITADSNLTTGYDSDFSTTGGAITVDVGSALSTEEYSDFSVNSGIGDLTITAGSTVYTGSRSNFSVAGGDLSIDAESYVRTGSYSDLTASNGNLTIDSGLDVTTGSYSDLSVTGGDLTINAPSTVTFGSYGSVDVNASADDIPVGGNLYITAGGTIQQSYSGTVTADGVSTFTVTAANSDLTMGNSGNSFAGTVTMSSSGEGSYRNVNFRNAYADNAVLSGLETATGLNNVTLYFDNAPSLLLPGMDLTGNLTVTVANGSLTQANAIAVDGSSSFSVNSTKDITLDNSANDFNDIVFRQANDVVLVETDGFSFNTYYTDLTGDLTVTAGGDITQTNYGVRVDGLSKFTLGSNNLALNATYNQWGQLQIVSANNVDIDTYTDVELLTSDIAGTFDLYARYRYVDLTQAAGATLTTGGNTTFRYFDSIALDNSDNVLGALLLDDGNNSSSYYSGTTRIRENDAITQSAAWGTAYDQVYLTTENDQAITLDNTSNQFSTINVTQLNDGNDTPGAVHIAEYSSMTQAAGWTTHGNTYIRSTNNSTVDFDNPDNVFAPLKVEGGTTYITENDTIEQYDAWTTGTTILNAYDEGVSGDGNVVLDNTGNVLGNLQVTAQDASITENSHITDYSAWNVPGTVILNSGSSGNYYIDLDNTSHILGDIDIDGNPSWVTIYENDDITQSGAWEIGTALVYLNAQTNDITLTNSDNVLGNIRIYGSPSSLSITEDDAITQQTTWSLGSASVNLETTSGQGIDLDSYNNQFGNLKITQNGSGTGAVSIREYYSDGITQAATGGDWLTRGVTTLDTNGQIVLTNTGNVLGDVKVNGVFTPSKVSITENHDITQATTWSLGTAEVILNAGGHQILLDNASNVMGNLAISGTSSQISIRENDQITQTSAWTLGDSPVTLAVSNDQLINLDQNNVLGDLVITQHYLNNANPGTVLINEVDAAGITQAGGWTTHGLTTLNAGDGNPIILTQADNVLANIKINGAPSALSITENDAITQETVWSLGSAPVNVTTSDDQAIVLSLDNVFGDLTVTQNHAAAETIGAVTIVEVDDAGLTQGGAWTTHGATQIDVGSDSITLGNKDNILGPLQVIGGTGTSKSVTIYAKDTETTAAITDVGSNGPWYAGPTTLIAYDNTGTTAGGGQINLTQSSILGDIDLQGTTVTITENSPITDGSIGWVTTGVTTLNTADSAILLDNVDNSLGNIALAGTPRAVTIVENDDITQAAAWNHPTIAFTLNAQSHDVLLTEVANQLGDLTVTAANATIVEDHTISDASAWNVPGLTTLTAGTSAIVLDVDPSSDFGTVSILSASDADIADINGITFATTTLSDTLTVTAGGAITQTGAIIADMLDIGGAGASAILNTATNNIVSLSVAFTAGGGVQYTDADNFALTSMNIGANALSLSSVAGTVTGLNVILSSTSALAVATGAGVTIPALTVAGPQTYTAGGTGVLLDGNLNSTATGAIQFNSPVVLNRDLSIDSTNSPVTFDSTLAGNTNDLEINVGTSTITFVEAVSGLGDSGTSSAALEVTGTSLFNSTLDANNGLVVSGPSTFKDSVTLQDGGLGSRFTGEVTLGKAGGMVLSGYKYMDFNSGIVLADGDATILTNNYPLRFNGGTVHGPYGLTLNAGTTEGSVITGLGTMGTDLTSLTVSAYNPTVPSGGISINGAQSYTAAPGSTIILGGNVTSTAAGDITFNSPVTLSASSSVTATDSAILFSSTINGDNDLVVNSGAGVKTFAGAIGSSALVGDGVGSAITLQGSGTTLFSDTVKTLAGISASGAVTFTEDVTLGDGDTGSVFTGVVTTGGTTLSGYDGIAFNGGLTLTGDESIVSNGSVISFGNTVSGPHDLSLNAFTGGAGTVSGLNWIGFNSDLTGLAITAQTLSLPDTGLAVAGPMSFTAAEITLNGAVGNSAIPATGQVDFNGPVTLATGAVTVTTNDADINFAGTVDGAQSLNVNSGTGTTTFTSAVGDTISLTNLTTDAGGTTAINGGLVKTTAAQTYSDALTLGAATTLTSTGSGDITFNSTINNGQILAVNTAGATVFNGVVGGATELTSIVTDAPGTVTINTSAITTTGSQTYNEALTLSEDATLTGLGVALNGTVEGAKALTVNATSGVATLSGEVGSGTQLTSLTVRGNAVTLSSDLSSDNGDISIIGPTTLGADIVIATGAGAGDITFSGAISTIDGAHDLTLTAGTGDVVLGGMVGGINALTAVTASGNNLTLPLIYTNSDTNQNYTALNDITLNQSRTLSAPIAFTADADNSGVGSFILLDGVSLNATNSNIDIRSADLDLLGSSSMNSGNGEISIVSSAGKDLSLGVNHGGMHISGAELKKISTSGGLNLVTTAAGEIFVDNILEGDSINVSGVLSLAAQGTGDISFIDNASTFNALTANATGGTINLAQNLLSTDDDIIFVTPVAVTDTATVDSGGGDIDFQSSIAVSNPLTVSSDGGILSFADSLTSIGTLLLNLGSGSVSGLTNLDSSLTGLTINSDTTITLPAITINGAQVYNGGVEITGHLSGISLAFNNVANVTSNGLELNAGTGLLSFANTVQFNANDVTLSGDEIDFNNSVNGSGALTLQPSANSVNVIVGGVDNATGALDLTAAELAWLPATLSSLNIGRSDGSGTLAIAGATDLSTAPLILNGIAGISQSAALTADALSLFSNGAIDLSNSGNDLGAMAMSGTPTSVAISDSTEITQNGAWVLDEAGVTLNAGDNDITLNEANNTFGTLSLTGGTVQITENATMDLGESGTIDSLRVVATGDITTSGPLTVTQGGYFKTKNDAGADITISNGSTLGLIEAIVLRSDGATISSGDIYLAPAGSTELNTLLAGADSTVTLVAGGGETISQFNPMAVGNLLLLGAGSHELTDAENYVNTLAADTGSMQVVIKETSSNGSLPVNVGTVGATAGITATGVVSLASAVGFAQTEAIVADGLLLRGTGPVTFENYSNDVNTLAATLSDKDLSFTDRNGLEIGTVSGVAGVALGSGDLTLEESSGNVTQSAAFQVAGLSLKGMNASFTLEHPDNDVTTLSGSLRSDDGSIELCFRDDNGFDIGTVAGRSGLSLDGDSGSATTLISSGMVTQSQFLNNYGNGGLALLGVNGCFVLDSVENDTFTLAADTGFVRLWNQTSVQIGSVETGTGTLTGVTTSGDLSFKVGTNNGAYAVITQDADAPLIVGGDLTLEATYNRGDVSLNNTAAAVTIIGDSLIGGNYTLTATDDAVIQAADTSLKVAGDLSIVGDSILLGGDGNLIQGNTSLSGSSSIVEIRESGVITLDSKDIMGNLTVVSEASSKSFDEDAIHGDAIVLNNAANSVTGSISIATVAPTITEGGDVQTGINQADGSSLKISGVASFTAEDSSVADSGGINLSKGGNEFGSLALNGSTVTVNEGIGATQIESADISGTFTLNSAGEVTQVGAVEAGTLSIVSGGVVTLNDGDNDVDTLDVEAAGNVAFTDANGFDIAGVTVTSTNVALTSGGDITQSGALTGVDTLFVTADGSIALDATDNEIATLGTVTAGTGIVITDSEADMTIDGDIVSAAGDIMLRADGGDLTLADTRTITVADAGDIYLVAGVDHNFINKDSTPGTGALVLDTGRFIIYSDNNVDTTANGLSGTGYMGRTYAANPPTGVTEAGNLFFYNDRETLTFTAVDQTKTYGDTNPELTYVVSGLLAGDTNSGAFSGDPTLSTLATSTSNVGDYAVTIGDDALINKKGYLFEFIDGNLTIGQRAIELTADDQRKTYGNADPSLTYNADIALIGSDTFTGVLSRAVGENVGAYAISQNTLAINDGNSGLNYVLTFVGDSLVIAQRDITLTADAASKTYGNADPTLSVSIAAGDLASVTVTDTLADVTGVLSREVGEDVGAYDVNLGTGTEASNYNISYVSDNNALTVNQRDITLTADAASKTYGNADPTLSVSIAAGDLASVTVTDTLADVTGVLSREVGEDVGAYDVNLGTGTEASNYNISYVTDNNALTITQRDITLSADALSKTYGNVDPTLNVSIASGSLGAVTVTDSLADVTGDLSREAGEDVGVYDVALGTGSKSANYNISYVTDNNALTIAQRDITLSADTVSKTYGDVDPSLSVRITAGSLATVTVSDTLLDITGVLSRELGEDVGVYDVALGTGSKAANYNMTFVANNNAVTIDPLALTITAADKSKVYGTADPALTYSGDVALIGSDSFTGSLSRAVGENVGNYDIVQNSLLVNDGNGGANYALSFVAGSLAVTPAALIVSANSDSKTYDSFAYSGGNGVGYSGFVNSEDSSVLGGTLSYAGSAQGAVNAGGYLITPQGLTAGNYDITFVEGSLIVNQANLVLTTSDVTKTYNGTLTAAGTALVDAVSGTALYGTDSLSGGSFAFTDANVGIGNKTVTVADVTINDGNSGNNYVVSYAANTSSTINKAAITISTSDVEKTYDGTLAATGSAIVTFGTLYNNASNGGSLDSISGGDFAFTDANAGIGNKFVTVDAVTVSDGNGGENYTVTYADNSSGTINRADISIASVDVIKIYDTTTVAAGNAEIVTGTLYTNASNGGALDTISGGTFVFADANAATNKTVSTSNVVVADGNAGGNYNVTYVDNTTSTINRAPLIITANDDGKTYDAAAYSGGNGVTFSAFAGTEDETVLNGMLSYAGSSQGAVGVGSYVIIPQGKTSQNYDITFTAGELVVDRAILTYVADTASREYGENNPLLDGHIEGFVTGDSVSDLDGSISWTTPAAVDSDSGSYAINGSGYVSANYDFNQAAANAVAFTIDKATLTYEADVNTIEYGDANPVLTGNVTGFKLGQDIGVLGGAVEWIPTSTATSDVGIYGVDGAGYTSTNYNFAQAAGNVNALTVEAATLTYTANAVVREYGDANPSLGGTITGLKNGELLSDVTSGENLWMSNAASTSNVGFYPIYGIGLTVTDSNYNVVIDQATANETAFSVTPAALQYTADAVSRQYGNENPTLTGIISGFKNGESVADLAGSVSWTTPATLNSELGSYAINGSGLSSLNYTIGQAAGNATALTILATMIDEGGVEVPIVNEGGVWQLVNYGDNLVLTDSRNSSLAGVDETVLNLLDSQMSLSQRPLLQQLPTFNIEFKQLADFNFGDVISSASGFADEVGEIEVGFGAYSVGEKREKRYWGTDYLD